MESERAKGQSAVDAARKKLAQARSKVDSAEKDRAAAQSEREQMEKDKLAPDADAKAIDKKIASSRRAEKKAADKKARAESDARALEPRVTEAQQAAQPSADAARTLRQYAAGDFKGASETAAAVEKGGQLPSLKKELSYVQALARFGAGDWKGSAELLGSPELAGVGETERFLGVAQVHLGDRVKAREALAKAHLAPEDGEAHAALGELYLEDKQLGPARDELLRAARAAPSDTRVLRELAQVQLGLDDNAAAAKSLARLMQLAPADREVAYLHAVALTRAGDHTAAEQALSRYLSKDKRTVGGDERYAHPRLSPYVVPTYGFEEGLPATPDEGAARNQVAIYLAERGELEQARHELEAAPASDGRASYNRGLLELSSGHLPQAQTLLDKAAKAAPTSPHAPQAQGVAALVAGDTAAAAAAFSEAQRRALAARQGDELPRVGLTVAALAASKPTDKALESPSEKTLRGLAAGKGAAAHAARVDLAFALEARGQHAEAARALGDAGGEADRSPEAAFVRGRIHEASDDSDGAQAAYDHAITLAPNYYDALVALGRVEAQRGNGGAARAALERAVALAPDEAEPHAQLSRVLASLGDGKGAEAEADLSRRLEAQATARQSKDNAIKSDTAGKVVGVTAFENTTHDPAFEWLSVGVAEALASDLPKLGGVRVVERAQMQKAADEVRLQQLGLVETSRAAELGKAVGADSLVVGSYQVLGGSKDGRSGNIKLLGRLVQVETGRVIRTGEAQGPVADLFGIERRLALDLLSDYARISGQDKDAFFRAQAPAVTSVEAVAKADIALKKGDAVEARAQLASAAAADSKFAAAYEDLKKESESTANVAVTPFDNQSKRPEDGWLAGGIAEALSGDLRKLGVPQVDRRAIDKVMEEKKFQELFSDDNAQKAPEAGKLIGAKALVYGGYQIAEGRIRIDAKLVDCASQKVLVGDSVSGRVEDLFALETELALKIAKQLNPTVKDSDADGLAKDRPSVAEYQKKLTTRTEVLLGAASAAPSAASDRRMSDEMPRGLASKVAARGLMAPVAMVQPAATAAATAGGGKKPDAAQPAAPPPTPTPPKGKVAVRAILETTTTVHGDFVRIDARLLDAATSEVLASSSTDGPRSQLEQLQTQLAADLVRTLSTTRQHARVNAGGNP